MESFERYAGFFPEEALTMMERHGGRSFAHDQRAAIEPPRAAPAPRLPAGAWADAILPEVVDDYPRARFGTPAPRRRRGTERLAHWFRVTLRRA